MTSQKTLTQDIVHTGKLMLRELGNELDSPGNRKLKISLVFLARTIRQLDSIGKLANARCVSDGYILYRSLVERYFLFVHLCERSEFEVFDDWCFKRRYEHLNTIKSIPEFSGKPEMRNRRFSDEEKERYQRVSADPRVEKWRRPDVEMIARRSKMKFLYDAGFDWASGYVHPVSTDGNDDYLHLMGREEEADSDEISVLLGNACLISVLHVQHVMNQPEYNWRAVLYDLIDAFKKTAAREDCDYIDTFRKVQHFHDSGAGLLSKTAT